jgi:hypothetical protein
MEQTNTNKPNQTKPNQTTNQTHKSGNTDFRKLGKLGVRKNRGCQRKLLTVRVLYFSTFLPFLFSRNGSRSDVHHCIRVARSSGTRDSPSG